MERQNLTMRMHNRRYHVAAISLHFMYVNFIRIHQTLRCTPAMAAGVSDRLWEMSDVVALLGDEREQRIEKGRETAKRKRNGPTTHLDRRSGSRAQLYEERLVIMRAEGVDDAERKAMEDTMRKVEENND